MSEQIREQSAGAPGYPHRIVRERLESCGIELTDFYFRHGANVFALTYEQDGEKRHTLIDTGYAIHQPQVFSILDNSEIDLNKVERIILTHRHPDHCGLAAPIALESGGRILVHSRFRNFAEGEVSYEERRWLGGFDPTQFRKCRMEYLEPSEERGSLNISGVDFPRMGDPIAIGGRGRLEIFTCPECVPTHSPDQLLIRLTPASGTGFRPTDELLFSGDLWLMRGPIFDRSLSSFKHRLSHGLYHVTARLTGANPAARDPRIQDAEAKEALKLGFNLIRVKPGHGDEFLGTNIIPRTLLAARDLLVKFGYAMNDDQAILKSRDLASRIAELREQAYAVLAEELATWANLGYSAVEIMGLLVRIYREQSGGGPLVEMDRRERRERLKELLTRLNQDGAQDQGLRRIAGDTLLDIRDIR